MSLFEFLMILLSIIVGLGLSELLGGLAGLLRSGRASQLCLPHATLIATLFLVLLQVFWESWSLHVVEAWTFPGLLLMLTAPVFLYLVTHMLYPADDTADLTAYYYSRARTIFILLLIPAIFGPLFRPLAFGMELFVLDNLSTVPTLAILGILAWSRRPTVHRILGPLCFVIVAADTLAITFTLS